LPQFITIVWNVDPDIFHLGPITIRYYGILFALSFFLGYNIIRSVFRKEGKPEADLETLLTYMMVGTIAGARLGHCLFYDPEYYLSNPLKILKVWEGGLASHGGAIGILTALYIYCRRRPEQPYLWLLDRMVITVALAGLFIRLGNFFNSEILGIPVDLPWAVIFDRIDTVPRHPAQLYESMAYGSIFVGLYRLYDKLGSKTPNGFLFGLFLTSVFGFRFFIEFVKERQAAYSGDLPLSVGQLLSIPLVITGVVLLVRAVKQGFDTSGPHEPTET
jgi:phosphatidylglycerol---prolipoprotein diacylglyceryl transferase